MNPSLQVILKQISLSCAPTKNNSKRTYARQELKKGMSTGQKELKNTSQKELKLRYEQVRMTGVK
jgi:hypothetical protein